MKRTPISLVHFLFKIRIPKGMIILLFGSIVSFGMLQPVHAEPEFGYWKKFAEQYRQNRESNNARTDKKCYDNCSNISVKNANQSLRYTMPLDQYTGYDYVADSYKSYGQSYGNYSLGNNSYASPYNAYVNSYGENSYIDD